MNEMFLLKMGEIVLKGLNRSTFEGRLHSNLTPAAEAIRQIQDSPAPIHRLCGTGGRGLRPGGSLGGLVPCLRRGHPLPGAVAARRPWTPSSTPAGTTWETRSPWRAAFKVESKPRIKSSPDLHPDLPGNRRPPGGAYPDTAVVSITPTTRSMWRSGRTGPLSTAPPSWERGACPQGWAARPPCCSPGASTAPWRAI